jgi:protein TonB
LASGCDYYLLKKSNTYAFGEGSDTAGETATRLGTKPRLRPRRRRDSTADEMAKRAIPLLAFALSVLTHAGIVFALAHAPRGLPAGLEQKFGPTLFEFQVLGEIKTEPDGRMTEASIPVVPDPVRRVKRVVVARSGQGSADSARPKPVPEDLTVERPAVERPSELSIEAERCPRVETAAVEPLASGQPGSDNRSDGVAVSTAALSSSVGGDGVAVSTAAPSSSSSAAGSPTRGRGIGRTQWHRIRAAIERYVRYPSMGRRFGWAGKVLLRFKLMSDGRVLEARVQQSSGFDLLDRSALEALERAAPLPPPVNPTEIVMPIVFALR